MRVHAITHVIGIVALTTEEHVTAIKPLWEVIRMLL